MPLTWIIVIATLGVLFTGGQELWTAMWNLKPTNMTCAQYIDKPSSAEWLDLSDCYIDYLDSVKKYKEGKLDKSKEKDVAYYTPVRAMDDPKQPIVLVVRAPYDIAEILDSLSDSSADEETTAKILKTNAHRLIKKHFSIEGIVSLMSSDNELHDLLEASPPEGWALAPDWKILDTEGKYSIMSSSLMVLASTGILVWMWRSYKRRAAIDALINAAVAEDNVPQKISDIANRKQ